MTLSVPEKGSVKLVEIEIENSGKEEAEIQLAYYTEPVLGVNRDNARHLTARWENGALLMSSPFSPVAGSLILTAFGGAEGCDCDRGAFLSGKWGSGGTLAPLPDPCAAVIVKKQLPPSAGKKSPSSLALPLGTRRRYGWRDWRKRMRCRRPGTARRRAFPPQTPP